ncbi:MAG: hypothetical protein OEZ20_08440 [candidate division WOR-3 bacterium]|nr:hypothetical protein [candidate division WOR-3 bacterium]
MPSVLKTRPIIFVIFLPNQVISTKVTGSITTQKLKEITKGNHAHNMPVKRVFNP